MTHQEDVILSKNLTHFWVARCHQKCPRNIKKWGWGVANLLSYYGVLWSSSVSCWCTWHLWSWEWQGMTLAVWSAFLSIHTKSLWEQCKSCVKKSERKQLLRTQPHTMSERLHWAWVLSANLSGRTYHTSNQTRWWLWTSFIVCTDSSATTLSNGSSIWLIRKTSICTFHPCLTWSVSRHTQTAYQNINSGQVEMPEKSRVTNMETIPWSKTDSGGESDTEISNDNDANQHPLLNWCPVAWSEGGKQVVKSKAYSGHVKGGCIKGINAIDLKLTKVPHHTTKAPCICWQRPTMPQSYLKKLLNLFRGSNQHQSWLWGPWHRPSVSYLPWMWSFGTGSELLYPWFQNPNQLTKHQTIPAGPPSSNMPLGWCGTALLHWLSKVETVGIQGKLSLSFISHQFTHGSH